MYAQASQRQGTIKSAFTAVFEFLMSKLTSRHGKRIIFITSLYFQVVRLERLKSDAMTKLNEIMSLAACEDALRFPVAIRGMVWHNTDLSSTLSEELLDTDISEDRVKEISERVVGLTPKWLRYGQTEMLADVGALIRGGSLMATAA